ncbi:MAG: serine hydrolase domain-containing protein [Hyphomonadaceae bacterium]
MEARDMMRGFPPAPEAQVTLANWRTRPVNQWAFHHIREIMPTALIRGGAQRTLQEDSHKVLDLAFAGPNGKETTVRRVLEETWADSLVVLRGGRVAFEWYSAVQDGTLPHILFSVSKGVSGAVAGCLVDRGLLDPALLVTHYVPEAEKSCFAGATVRQVLDMLVSCQFVEDYVDPESDFQRYRVATGFNPLPEGQKPQDLRSYLLSLRKDKHEHGSKYHYLSPATDMLGWIMERASGKRFADLVSENIWAPMGGGDAQTTVDRLGVGRPAGGICCTPRDLAIFGEMIRLRGVAGGRQVVPGWWIDDMLTNGDHKIWAASQPWSFPDGWYRSKFVYTGKNALYCGGIHGQAVYANIDAEVSISLFSSQESPSDDVASPKQRGMLEAVANALRPRML